MPIRILPDDLINKIAAGEVVERPASVVKELIENALDAGADQIVVDVTDGGRTMISVIDNGAGMDRETLSRAIMRHATSKLETDDLLNITTMGFRGEALPSIASVSEMEIDSRGHNLNCTTGEIKPSPWDGGTRVRVKNLFANVPARLKFLRSDRAEMMSVTEVVKRLAMARADVGFVLNQKYFFPANQPILERIYTVCGDDLAGRMIEISGDDGKLKLTGFVSEPTLRRASSVDQYLFVNGRPVRDKVLVGALRAAYMDVMSAREFPVAVLNLTVPSREVDVNVSPAKTDVHFLEPARVRGFIIKTIRGALAAPLAQKNEIGDSRLEIREMPIYKVAENNSYIAPPITNCQSPISTLVADDFPLGRAIGQFANKYIIAESVAGLVVIDQHAAHERITYEKMRMGRMKTQPLLVPIIVQMRDDFADAIAEFADEFREAGLVVEKFGPGAIAIVEKPAEWDLEWGALLTAAAQEIIGAGHTSRVAEKLHLSLANRACHNSVRSGRRLSIDEQNALLREIENTERGGQCNHGRPVYRVFSVGELDGMFERK